MPNHKPLCGMAVKKYLWRCRNVDKVRDYYYNNVDFSKSREENIRLMEEHGKANKWETCDMTAGRLLIIRSHRILDGKIITMSQKKAMA